MVSRGEVVVILVQDEYILMVAKIPYVRKSSLNDLLPVFVREELELLDRFYQVVLFR